MLNPDGVAYIRLASYYANGEFNLTVSGYWGPMLSWLIAPLLGVTADPLDAARIAMGLSAVVFLLGCLAIFRTLEISKAGTVLATWVAAVASAVWSVENITPDLLVGGLMCLATSRLLSPRWPQSRLIQLTAGVLWGAAYLGKGVAFPLAFGTVLVVGCLWVFTRLAGFKAALRAALITLVGFGAVAGPWVAALSWKYQGLVISTTGKIAHAIVGPPDRDRSHSSVSTLQAPEPGRLTVSEDPSHLPYAYWSPFESWTYARHQLRVIVENSYRIVTMLAAFDWLHLGLFPVLFGLLVHTPWRENMRRERWRWAGGVLLCFCGVYLPVFAQAQRYYFPAFPVLIAAAMGMTVSLTSPARPGLNLPRLAGLALVTVSFSIPALLLPVALRGLEGAAAVSARDLAKRLQAAGVRGEIAGVGDFQNLPIHYVEYIAFFTDQRYFGQEPNPTSARIKASGAKLIVVRRSGPVAVQLGRDTSFKNLDPRLFRSPKEADRFPFQVYELVTPDPGPKGVH
jgi:hypothetical protein